MASPIAALRSWFEDELNDNEKTEILRFIYGQNGLLPSGGGIGRSDTIMEGRYVGPAPKDRGIDVGPASATTCPNCGHKF